MLKDIGSIVKSTFQIDAQDHEDSDLIESLAASDTIPESLAYAILFLGLARADGDVARNEDIVIHKVLGRTFPDLKGDPATVMETAHNMLDSFRDPQTFIARIKEQYSAEERLMLLDTIRKIVSADDVEEPIELYIEKKYAKHLA